MFISLVCCVLVESYCFNNKEIINQGLPIQGLGPFGSQQVRIIIVRRAQSLIRHVLQININTQKKSKKLILIIKQNFKIDYFS